MKFSVFSLLLCPPVCLEMLYCRTDNHLKHGLQLTYFTLFKTKLYRSVGKQTSVSVLVSEVKISFNIVFCVPPFKADTMDEAVGWFHHAFQGALQ